MLHFATIKSSQAHNINWQILWYYKINTKSITHGKEQTCHILGVFAFISGCSLLYTINVI